MEVLDNQVHQGDCLALFQSLPAASVDLIFADPPFNIGYKYDVYDDQRSADEYLQWSREWIRAAAGALTPNGTFWLAIGDEFAAELKLIAQREAQLSCRSWVIWYYTFGVNCKRGFSRSHTHLFHFVKDPRDFTFNQDNPAIRVPSARQLVYADARANPNGRLPDNTWILRPQDIPESFQPDEDTWYYPRVAGTFKEREGFHGCQMPEQVLGRIIRTCSNPNDRVLDPFSGSGTTLAVAKKLGRRWIGFELSEQYAQRIEARLEKIQIGDPLTGTEDPLASSPKTHRGKQRRDTRSTQERDADEDRLQEAIRRVDPPHVECILVQPELQRAFQEACQNLNVYGEPVLWNRRLLKVKRSSVPPRAADRSLRSSAVKPTRRALEPLLHACEVSLRRLTHELGATATRILADPSLIQQFDRMVEPLAPGARLEDYRWGALQLRRLFDARAIAESDVSSLELQDFPPPRSLEQIASEFQLSARQAQEGFYLLFDQQQSVAYAGASRRLLATLHSIAALPSWRTIGIAFASWIFHPKPSETLKAALVGRHQPYLNAPQRKPETNES